jgi:acyl-CoA synthetase (NDP forming)
MEQLFYPQSLVVVGISDSPSNLAQQIVENLDGAGFTGRIYCVGRRAGQLNGRPIFDSIEAIDEVPDLAVLLTPAETIPDTLDACGRKGIRYAVIEAGGFSEFREERKELETNILEIAKRWSIRFMGPNCVGVINTANGLALPFYPVEPPDLVKGNISFISQSGGLVHDFLKRCRYEKLRCGKLLSIGNKLMLDENDFLEFLIADPHTHVIGLYLESVMDGRRLMAAARSSEKPIIVLKGNRSPASRQIAKFHTAALAGDERVLHAALRQCGMHQVRSMTEMVGLLKMFALPLLKGRNLLLISRSGGQAVLLADAVHAHGFSLTPLPSALADFVSQKVKAGVIRPTNPVDLGDVFDIRSYAEMIEMSLKDEEVDGVVLFHYFPDEEKVLTEALVQSTAVLSQRYEKPVAFCVLPGKKDLLTFDTEAYFPIFEDADQVLDALAVSIRHFENQQKKGASGPHVKYITRRRDKPTASYQFGFEDRVRRRGEADSVASCKDAGLPGGTSRSAIALAKHPVGRHPVKTRTPTPWVPGNYIDEGKLVSEIIPVDEAFDLLRASGLSVADHLVVSRLEEALEGAARIGYPVALKIASPITLHKTERSGVRLNLYDGASLGCAFKEMKADQYLVQRMVQGCETILGAKRDPQFGPIVLFGMGGIFAELFDDVAVRVAPLDENTTIEMINEIKGSAILNGYRGSAFLDRKALSEALLRVSHLLFEHPEIQNLDINPLVVLEQGKGAVLVDAKIERF